MAKIWESNPIVTREMFNVIKSCLAIVVFRQGEFWNVWPCAHVPSQSFHSLQKVFAIVTFAVIIFGTFSTLEKVLDRWQCPAI
jgi:ABC-type microcin C transport system permease subunit YejB